MTAGRGTAAAQCRGLQLVHHKGLQRRIFGATDTRADNIRSAGPIAGLTARQWNRLRQEHVRTQLDVYNVHDSVLIQVTGAESRSRVGCLERHCAAGKRSGGALIPLSCKRASGACNKVRPTVALQAGVACECVSPKDAGDAP